MTGESEESRGEVLAYKSPQGKEDEAAPHRPLPAKTAVVVRLAQLTREHIGVAAHIRRVAAGLLFLGPPRLEKVLSAIA